MEYTTFCKYRAAYCSNIHLSKLKQDECDTCFSFMIILHDPRATFEQKQLATLGMNTHQNFAKEQRLAMRQLKEFVQTYADKHKNNLIVNCHLNLDFIPESVEESLNEVFDRLDLNENRRSESEACPVLLEMQDFGGNLTLPHFGSKRPSIDYYTSNLLLHMFVISDVSHATNHVILYDERGMGKGVDALCSLRWFHYHTMIQKYIADGKILQFPKVLIVVMDNCVGQNKSKAIMNFFAMLSIVFPFQRVMLLFLVSGHSHMNPDRVVSWVRSSLKKGANDADLGNLYVPHQYVEKMNSVKSVEATFWDHLQPDKPMYEGWGEIMSSCLHEVSNYTSNHCFEFYDGKVLMKQSFLDDNGVSHTFCTDIPVVRKLLMLKILGEGKSLEDTSPYKLILQRNTIKELGNSYTTTIILFKFIICI